MDKKKLAKILIPLAIVLLIAGVWLIKNNVKSDDLNIAAGAVTPVDEQHFALSATTLDLDELLQYKIPIVIDFGSNTCLPCISFYPTLKSVHADMYGKVIVKYVDVDKYPQIARTYPVQVVPTQVFINADGTAYVPSKNVSINFSMYSYKESNAHAYTVHEGVLTEKQFLAILSDMGVE